MKRLCILLALVLMMPACIRAKGHWLTIHMIDVGSGDAFLVQYTEADHTYNILFDGGFGTQAARNGKFNDENYVASVDDDPLDYYIWHYRSQYDNLIWQLKKEKDKTDTGNATLNYLNSLGVTTIDYMISTHPHIDHVGGLLSVLVNLDVKHAVLWHKNAFSTTYYNAFYKLLRDKKDNGVIDNSLASRAVIEGLESELDLTDTTKSSAIKTLYDTSITSKKSGTGIDVIVPEEGNTITLGNLTLTQLADTSGKARIKMHDALTDQEDEAKTLDRNVNNESLVYRLEVDGFSALFTGDLERKGQLKLIKNHEDELKCDVLKVPHHGHNNISLQYTDDDFNATGLSANHEFFYAADPSVALVSSNAGDDSGPSVTVLRELINSDVYTTRSSGSTVITVESRTITADAEPEQTHAFQLMRLIRPVWYKLITFGLQTWYTFQSVKEKFS